MSEQPRVDIEAIRARLAAATPGPWYVSPAYVAAHGTEWEVEDKPDASGIWVAHCQNEANAEAIAHAPADLAALLAEVERLRERLTLTEDKVNLVHDWLYPWPEENGLRYATLGHSKVRAALLAAGMEEGK